jgi:glycosyltransferase involved in cell wall biosynthesis
MTTSNTFSVLLSVYHRENPAFLRKSLESIVDQTRKPEKIVLVKDGKLTTALEDVIESFRKQHETLFRVVGYEVNKGLGEALNYGMKFIDTPFVARMDADDIAIPTRFEEQMNFLDAHPEIDIVGSLISEFNVDPDLVIRTREVPEAHENIKEKARLTNPMNHMTVVFKKNNVLSLGGYAASALYFEDYDLWVRMLSNGMKFHNLQKKLVLVRVGNDMVGKRHGWKYSTYEFNHFKRMYAYKFISTFEFGRALALRLPLRLLPKQVLVMFYNFILRRKHN